MEQRRVILFLSLSFLVLVLNSMLFSPPRAPEKKLPAEKPQQEVAEPEDPVVAAAKPQAPVDENPEGDVQMQPQADVPVQYVSLGSVAKDSPYRLLATFTNRGAGVQRVELASSRYRDLQDRGGYLGHLQLAPDPSGGLLVQVVGAGTPAAVAGLEPGDRIVEISDGKQDVALNAAGDLAQILQRRKPGRQVTLKVARGNAPPQNLEVTLTRRPLEVIRPEAENVLMRADRLPLGFVDPPSFQLTLEQLGTIQLRQLITQAKKAIEEAEKEGVIADIEIPEEIAGIELRNSNWEVLEHNETNVTFRRPLPKFNLEVVKRYHLEPVPVVEVGNVDYPGYELTLDLEIRNLGGEPLDVAYRLDGPNGLPLEGWWYSHKVGRTWSAVGIRDVVARFAESDPVQIGPASIAEDDVEPLLGRPLAFIGVDAQYFSAMLLPQKPSLETQWIDQADTVLLSPPPRGRSAEGRYANVTCRLISKPVSLAAGNTLKHSYTLFAGPKRPDLLANYLASDNRLYSLSDLLYYGWFGGVAKAMLAILHFFYGIVHNYGIAIILLTVLVRGCLFPLSRKQALSMARMQELRPEMDKIKEKYKNDMQKQSQAMQELYRKHNINPVGGCLPMFIQLPVFLGLYRALMVDVELRQAPLIRESVRWCSNLAAPDMFFNWSSFMPKMITSGEGIFALGPYLNILPLVTVALFILQQKMFMPEPANEQAALQQKIMKYMMLVMAVLFFKVASGLCIYFIASSLWGIAERKLVPPIAGATPSTSGTKPPGPEVGRSSFDKNGQSKQKSKRRGKSKKKR